MLKENFNVGSVRRSVYKATVLVASFSSVMKTVRIYLSCFVTALKRCSCNTSGLHDTLAGADLFPGDVTSVPCFLIHIVTTSSRFAIVFNPLTFGAGIIFLILAHSVHKM